MRKIKAHITFVVELELDDEYFEDHELEKDISDSELADHLTEVYGEEGPEILNEVVYEGPEVKVETVPAEAAE
jgi:hypothetical protein